MNRKCLNCKENLSQENKLPYCNVECWKKHRNTLMNIRERLKNENIFDIIEKLDKGEKQEL